jgi:glucans biosynthesis protein C
MSRRWMSLLILGAAVSLPASIAVAVQYGGGAWVIEHAVVLKWATAFATSATMAVSVFGWLGCFIRFFSQPSDKIRYLADASYWIYVAHLPLVLALQIAMAKWALPWWIQLPLLDSVVFSSLILTYHAFVRFTWVGAWLNCRRASRAKTGAPRVSSNPI